MTKQELVEKIAAEIGTTKAAAGKAVAMVFDSITDSLKKGKSVNFVGFGTFSVSKRKARKGRNPQTGDVIKIAASKAVRFKAGATLKKVVNKK